MLKQKKNETVFQTFPACVPLQARYSFHSDFQLFILHFLHFLPLYGGAFPLGSVWSDGSGHG